jgi:hypothetical protein
MSNGLSFIVVRFRLLTQMVFVVAAAASDLQVKWQQVGDSNASACDGCCVAAVGDRVAVFGARGISYWNPGTAVTTTTYQNSF